MFLLRLLVACILLSSFLLTGQWLRQHFLTAQSNKPSNVVHVGLLDDTPPYCFYNDQNELVGINLEIAKTLVERMGKKPVIEAVSFNRLTSGLITGQYDMVSIGSITPERGRVVRYLYPHLISADVLVVHPRLKHLKSIDGFKQTPYKIGVYNGTSYIRMLKQRGFEPHMVIYPNQRDVFLAFYKHRVDGIIMAETVAIYIQKTLDPSLVIVPEKVRTDRHYGFALRKDNLALWKEANHHIKAMVLSGAINEIHQRWHLPAAVNLELLKESTAHAPR